MNDSVKKESENKLRYMSTAYLLAVVLVIFGHSHPLGGTPYPKEPITFIYLFHMQFFFFISGFLLLRSNSIKRNGYFEWLDQKFLRLMIPYILLSLLAFMPKYFVSAYTTDKIILDSDHFIKMLLYPHLGVWSHFWFVYPLLFYYAVFGIYKKYSIKFSQLQNIIILITFIILGIITFFFQPDNNIFGIKDIARCLVFYTSGMFLSYIENEKIISFTKITIRNGMPVIIICITLALTLAIIYWVPNESRLLIATLMIISLFILSVLLQNNFKEFSSLISKNVLTIYLYAWPFQAVVEICLRKFINPPWYITFPILFVIGFSLPPGGHPKSPTCGHLKIPHPTAACKT